MRTSRHWILPACAWAFGIAGAARSQVGVDAEDERSALVLSSTSSEGDQLSSGFLAIQGDLFVTAECASELLQDSLKLVVRAIEERRAIALRRALRELYRALLTAERVPRELVASIAVALALLGEELAEGNAAAERAASIRWQRATLEHTPHLGTILVDWRVNAPQGLYTATPALQRLWLATRYLQLYPVLPEELAWISALRVAFETEIELRDAARELRELDLCLEELWGRASAELVWVTRGAGVWSPRAVDEDLLVSNALSAPDHAPQESELWSFLLRVAIDSRGEGTEPESMRSRLLDLLALWPKSLRTVPLLERVTPELWSDLAWHARGALYLALRECDILVTSGPVTPARDDAERIHVIVEPRPRLYEEILELLDALEMLSARAEARGVAGLRPVRRRIASSAHFVRLCLAWTADAEHGRRSAEREAELVAQIREDVLSPRVRHAHARLVIEGAGWMERSTLERISVLAADGRRYTGVRTRLASGR
jgi:hypothetical protein